MKYAFIRRHEQLFPTEVMCRVLCASRSGYYAWRKGGVSTRQIRRSELLEQIQKIYKESRGNYGSPRITRELRKSGIVVNKKTVEELMRENGIQAKRKKKFKATTNSNHDLPIAKNLLKRRFKVELPIRL